METNERMQEALAKIREIEIAAGRLMDADKWDTALFTVAAEFDIPVWDLAYAVLGK